VFTVHASLNTSWQVRTEYEHRVHYNEDLSSELLLWISRTKTALGGTS